MKGGDQQQLNLPVGFRFHLTDEELVVHYLCRRCAGQQIPASVVADIDLYKFNPWELPGMSFYGEKEWYNEKSFEKEPGLKHWALTGRRRLAEVFKREAPRGVQPFLPID